MFLSLKTIAFDSNRNGFYSPTMSNFLWPMGDNIVESGCEHAEKVGMLGEDCHCGIWSSPNEDALDEYAKYPNSVLLFLNTHGRSIVWPGPFDIPNTHVLRSWGIRIIGVIREIKQGEKNAERILSMAYAREYFSPDGNTPLEVWELADAQRLIQQNWIKVSAAEGNRIDPYQFRPIRSR